MGGDQTGHPGVVHTARVEPRRPVPWSTLALRVSPPPSHQGNPPEHHPPPMDEAQCPSTPAPLLSRARLPFVGPRW